MLSAFGIDTVVPPSNTHVPAHLMIFILCLHCWLNGLKENETNCVRNKIVRICQFYACTTVSDKSLVPDKTTPVGVRRRSYAIRSLQLKWLWDCECWIKLHSPVDARDVICIFLAKSIMKMYDWNMKRKSPQKLFTADSWLCAAQLRGHFCINFNLKKQLKGFHYSKY